MSLQEEKVLAEGLTATQWVEMLSGNRPAKAKRAINYFDGLQEDEMITLLSDPSKGRKKWKERGIIPRFRNITKMVVEKSGRLFLAGLPQFDLFVVGQTEPDETLNKLFAEEIAKTEFHETMSQFDQMVRLLKTGILLVQYDIDEKKMVLDILHRGNCAVMIDPTSRAITAMIYRVSDCEGIESFRIFTEDQIIDLMKVSINGQHPTITVTGEQDNPWGIVPAVPFYDTTIPRSGFWVDGGDDLIQVNEMVNLHLTDSEFLMSWMKKPTLFTNARIGGNDENLEVSNGYGTNGMPRLVATAETITTGPDKIVQIDTQGVDGAFVEYKAPQVDITPMDTVVNGWVSGFAQDWSVRIRSDHEARATSGFQLVVESIDNRELRIQRQRMMTQGLKRFYRVLRTVMNHAYGTVMFPENTDLFVEFVDEELPVDAKEQEEMYSLRILEGRSSVVAYLEETKGISREEAIELALQYKADQLMLNPEPETMAVIPGESTKKDTAFEPVSPGTDGEDKSDEDAEVRAKNQTN